MRALAVVDPRQPLPCDLVALYAHAVFAGPKFGLHYDEGVTETDTDIGIHTAPIGAFTPPTWPELDLGKHLPKLPRG